MRQDVNLVQLMFNNTRPETRIIQKREKNPPEGGLRKTR